MIEVFYVWFWVVWENVLVFVYLDGSIVIFFVEYVYVFLWLENYYFINVGFLEKDGQIFENMDKIVYISGYIVQGCYDMICLLQMVQKIVDFWSGVYFSIICDVGYVLLESGISVELVRIMDFFVWI